MPNLIAARRGQGVSTRLFARRVLDYYRQHNEQMQSTFVDEFRLRADLGPLVEYLSVGELERAAQAVTQSRAG